MDGHNVELDFRWALGQYHHLPVLAADLVRRKVTVIVATGGGVASAPAARAATSTIPIVFVAGTDPIGSGLVATLNRPEANLTGISLLIGALMAKKLELLHELLPKATLIGVLVNSNFPGSPEQLSDAQAAAEVLGKKLLVVDAGIEGDLKAAFSTLVQQRAQALVLAADPFLNARAEQILSLAHRNALPTISPIREYVLAGGLMSYGTSVIEAHRLAGIYVARILKGDSPADLPVMQSTKFELVINLKAAKALGLEIPPTLLARADEVIE